MLRSDMQDPTTYVSRDLFHFVGRQTSSAEARYQLLLKIVQGACC